jgi:hypothetical protein
MIKWAPLPGYAGKYEISTEGDVRSHWRRNPRLLTWSIGTVEPIRDVHHGIPVSGPRTVHSLVALTYLGPRPERMQIAHLDGDRKNPRLANIVYATPTENNRHKKGHGTLAEGEGCSASKLTADQVLEIRRLYAAGARPQWAIGARFGITQSQVSVIVRGKSWSSLPLAGAS